MPDPKLVLAGAVQAVRTWIRAKGLREDFQFGKKKQSWTEGILESFHHRLRKAGGPSHPRVEIHLIGVLGRNQDFPAS